MARKIKDDGSKGGGPKTDGGGGGGGNGKGKKSTTDLDGVYLASAFSGDGFYLDGDKITAGTIVTGEVIIDSGTYTVDHLYSGVAYDTAVPTFGTVTITGATTDVTVHDAGTLGSYGAIRVGYYNDGGTGLLNILAGASLSSINEVYYDNGTI